MRDANCNRYSIQYCNQFLRLGPRSRFALLQIPLCAFLVCDVAQDARNPVNSRRTFHRQIRDLYVPLSHCLIAVAQLIVDHLPGKTLVQFFLDHVRKNVVAHDFQYA